MQRSLIIAIASLLIASAAAAVFLVNEPYLEEVVVELRASGAPELGATTSEFRAAAGGLAVATPEIRPAYGGLGVATQEIRPAPAGLGVAVIEIWVPPNLPPVAVCQDTILALDAQGQATLDPTDVDGGSYDPDEDPITLAVDASAFECADIGDHLVTLTVTDVIGATDECEALVTVADLSPPQVTWAPYPDHLWPPRHDMMAISLSTSVTDNCPLDGGGAAGAMITIESSEPDDAQGGGDGHTSGDIEIRDAPGNVKVDSSASGTSNAVATATYEDGDSLFLRAERLGNGAVDAQGNHIGRNYTITLTVTDSSGLETSVTAVINVPHDQSAHAATCEDPDCGGG